MTPTDERSHAHRFTLRELSDVLKNYVTEAEKRAEQSKSDLDYWHHMAVSMTLEEVVRRLISISDTYEGVQRVTAATVEAGGVPVPQECAEAGSTKPTRKRRVPRVQGGTRKRSRRNVK